MFHILCSTLHHHNTVIELTIMVAGVLDNLGQLQHGELTGVAQVEWPNVITFHQPHQPLNLEEGYCRKRIPDSIATIYIFICSWLEMTYQIRNVLETSGLLAIAVNCQRLLP